MQQLVADPDVPLYAQLDTNNSLIKINRYYTFCKYGMSKVQIWYVQPTMVCPLQATMVCPKCDFRVSFTQDREKNQYCPYYYLKTQ